VSKGPRTISAESPPSGAMPNGWIYHRHLFPLSPRDGTNVFYETW
jgi:hypothetical protein